MRFVPMMKPLGAPSCWCVEDKVVPMWDGCKEECGYDKNIIDPNCCGCARNPNTERETQEQAEREHLLPPAESMVPRWLVRRNQS